jgi:hypothetical protein
MAADDMQMRANHLHNIYLPSKSLECSKTNETSSLCTDPQPPKIILFCIGDTNGTCHNAMKMT